jgi:hypothetical protein
VVRTLAEEQKKIGLALLESLDVRKDLQRFLNEKARERYGNSMEEFNKDVERWKGEYYQQMREARS